jgi:hypothetical protein
MRTATEQAEVLSPHSGEVEKQETFPGNHEILEVLQQCVASEVVNQRATESEQEYESDQTTGAYIIQFPDDVTWRYDLAAISEALQKGELDHSYPVRPEGGDTKEWATLGQLIHDNFSLRVLYEPMWAHISHGFWYGAIAGIALKSLDTTVSLFNADPNGAAGLLFLMVIGSLFLTRYFSLAPLVAVFIAIKAGFTVNFFFMFLGASAVGIMFGGPFGALIGAIVGLIRKNRLPKVPDGKPEGSSPYLWGILVPVIFLSTTIPLYLYWLMPKVIDWLATASS